MTTKIMQHFSYTHLPPHLQAVSGPFCELAKQMDERLPDNDQKADALRGLLRAKDSAVRAVLEG